MKVNNPLEANDHRSGMTVPEGYFENFAERMTASLPEQAWERPEGQQPGVLPMSLWQRVRPYAYMAAMFAGIWLMMNMFTLFPGLRGIQHGSTIAGNETATTITAEPGENLMLAFQDEAFMNDYFTSYDSYDSSDLYDALYEDGFTPCSQTFDEI